MRVVYRHLILSVFLLSLMAQADAQLLAATSDKPVHYTPTQTTESLMERYSQVHSKPNQYWQLTDEEWARYESIKKNSPWAEWRNNASPLALLSHYAPSVEEKRRYARIEAELDTWRQYSVTEFQMLYDKERDIVHARYKEWIEKRQPTLASIKPYDRLRLFIQASDCNAQCRSLVGRVLKTQAKVDIYVTGAKTDTAIFKWAEMASIPVERVKTKEITLNHDNGVFKLVTDNLGLPASRLPALFRQIGNTDQVIPI